MGKYDFKRLIAGSVVGATLMGVTLAPSTGWVTHQQVQALLFGPISSARMSEIYQKTLARQESVAAAQPDNFPLQMALALRKIALTGATAGSVSAASANSGKLLVLHGLEANYSNQPSLYAAILRDLSRGAVKLDHRTDQNELEPAPTTSRERSAKRAPLPADLAEWERAALTGAKLDPDNAFFPMMRAIGLFASNQDEEALKEIKHAGALTRYEDYVRDEATGGWALMEAGQDGEAASIQRIAVSAAVLLPHFTATRSAARLAVVQAVRLEQAGDTEGGFAIRQALLRCGARMRSDSNWLIGSFVGEALSALAEARPGGAPALPRDKDLTSEVRSERRLQAYKAYLTRIGHSDEIAWVNHEENARKAVKEITSKGLDKGPASIASLISTISLWAAGMATLGNILFLLLFGAMAAWLSRTRRVMNGEPLHPRVALGMGVSILPLALISTLWNSASSGAANGILAVTFLGGLAAAPFLLGRGQRYPGQLAENKAEPTAGSSARLIGATVVIATLIGSLLLWMSGSIGGYTSAMSAMMGSLSGNNNANGPLMRLLSAALVTGVSLLTWIVLAIVSRVRRIPVSVGTMRGFARVALPLAAVLSLAYVGLVGMTGAREAAARKATEASVQHEGRACAAFSGLTWPTFAP